jgi:hypothetical protein
MLGACLSQVRIYLGTCPAGGFSLTLLTDHSALIESAYLFKGNVAAVRPLFFKALQPMLLHLGRDLKAAVWCGLFGLDLFLVAAYATKAGATSRQLATNEQQLFKGTFEL